MDIETPSGESFAIDDPALIQILRQGLVDRHQLRLMRSQRSMTIAALFRSFLLLVAISGTLLI
jgi:hypothetical protein